MEVCFHSIKGTSVGPRHCIWTPDCPLKLSYYPALDPTKMVRIAGSLEKCIRLKGSKVPDFRNCMLP